MALEHESVELSALRDELCGKFLPDASACKEPAVFRCHKCGLFYCIDHASEIDPKHRCKDCLHVAIEESPLLNEDGTRLPGRLLRPVGNSFTEMNKLITDMSDEELKTFIQGYIVLVHEAEQLKTMREITLAHAKHEAFDRQIAKIEKLGGEIIFPSRKPRIVKPAKAKASATDTLAAKLAKAGVTPEMLAAIIAAKTKG